MLTASGRSVPWPLPDSEQAAQPVSPMPPTRDTTENLEAADRMRVEGRGERQDAPAGSSSQVAAATLGNLRARLTRLVRGRREPPARASSPQIWSARPSERAARARVPRLSYRMISVYKHLSDIQRTTLSCRSILSRFFDPARYRASLRDRAAKVDLTEPPPVFSAHGLSGAHHNRTGQARR